MPTIESLRKQSERLSLAEDILILRIQKIIRLRAEVDDQIDRLERQEAK